MTNRLLLVACVSVSSLSLLPLTTSWGQAVSVDMGSLQQRLNAIDLRLNTLEKSRSLRAAAMPAGSAAYAANDIESRLTDLEQESSQNTGRVERATFALQQVAKRLDDLTKDLELRLADLETRTQKLEVARPVAVPAPAPAAPVTAVASGGDEGPAAPPVAPAAPVTVPATPQDHYNKAYAYLTAADYPHARAYLESFLKKYPTHPLADSAYYWLGEVYLVQNNPTSAVVTFRDGLKAFPKGAKAPSNLYKMGVALEQLKQPKLAKGAWEKLTKDYPNAPETAKAKAKLAGLK